MENKKTIEVTDINTGQVDKTITTNGYILLYLDGDKLRADGDIELGALAPFLIKTLAEKMSKGF